MRLVSVAELRVYMRLVSVAELRARVADAMLRNEFEAAFAEDGQPLSERTFGALCTAIRIC